MTRPSLARELATPLTPGELALGGCARLRSPAIAPATPIPTPRPGAVLALWRLLVHVMGDLAPAPETVATWYAQERARIRTWAERELCRKVVGFDGCPPLAAPRAIRQAATRWAEERRAARAVVASAALARAL